MRLSRVVLPWPVLALLLLLPACGGTTGGTFVSLPVQQFYAGADCGSQNSQAGIKLYTSYADAEKALKDLPGFSHVIKTGLSAIQANNNYILQINMGLKRTGGYAIKLGSQTMKLASGIAVIQLTWRQPAAGSFVTQALTSPCILLEIPGRDYNRIRIIDQHQQEKALINL